MCGITGWVSFRRDLRAEQATVDTMTETMSCRGPDDRGTWFAEHAALGHRRLAIIDLPGGRQPMSADTPGGAVAIVYSGEAYNFTELRAELIRRGHRFTTDSDTEVVLHAYLEWGDALAERLNGMYAFAIWDSREDKLVMVRDRMGIKPFYYYETSDGVLFGSEPKAILANPAAEHTVTLDGIRELFAFVKTPGHAVWEGMREVEPGTVITVGSSGLRTTRYWALQTRPHPDDQATSVAHVRELLEDIVRRQLVADVPRCTLLSGGLDSSAMTAIAAKHLAETGQAVRSFAVDFAGRTENFVSLLRGAARDVLPQSVVDRVKSPYPSTQDPGYTVKLQNSAREYLSSPGHPVFDIVNRDWLARAVEAEAQITQTSRHGLERALDLALWLDMYKPALKLS
jgi:asparagine synthase (glutamine-hydrolysing)